MFLKSATVLLFVSALVIKVPACLSTLGYCHNALFLLTSSPILQSKLVDYNGFTLVRKTCSLSVNVSIVTVANDFTVW